MSLVRDEGRPSPRSPASLADQLWAGPSTDTAVDLGTQLLLDILADRDGNVVLCELSLAVGRTPALRDTADRLLSETWIVGRLL